MSLSSHHAINLPSGLPVPLDDGACNHLLDTMVPPVTLLSTSGRTYDVSALEGLTVIFCYPRTGAPGENIPQEWDLIPGARGCTPQACSFRDSFSELIRLGASRIFGMSVQDTAYQCEVKDRLHLPYELLSDEQLAFGSALGLPTFDWKGKRLLRRVTIAVKNGKIVKTWYPVFPSDKSAEQVIEWLKCGEMGEI